MVKICEVVDGCEDCPKYGDDCDGDKMTEHIDLISRADAIEAVAQQWLFEASAESPYVNDDDIGEYRKLAEELFEDVPSADAVQGEWLEIEDYNGDYHYQCSVCKDEFYLEYGTPKENGYAYCPSCGARMKGGAE